MYVWAGYRYRNKPLQMCGFVDQTDSIRPGLTECDKEASKFSR
jgi:hypothetical protein